MMVAENRNPRQQFQMAAAHLDHLESLLAQEQKGSYKRINYMSELWQTRLLRKENNIPNKGFHPLSYRPPSPASPRMVSGSESTFRSSMSINPIWREKVSEWMYQVIDHFNLDRDVVGIAVFYLDKYLSVNYYSTKVAFQLAAIASIYLSVKLHSEKKIPIQTAQMLGSSSAFTIEHIASMEMHIAESLGWLLHPPTAVAFLRNLHPIVSECLFSARNAKLCSNVVDFASYLSELSVCDYSFIETRPSSIAIASILSAMEYYRLPQVTLDHFVTLAMNSTSKLDFDKAEVCECRQQLKQIYELATPNDLALWGDDAENTVKNIIVSESAKCALGVLSPFREGNQTSNSRSV